MMDAEILDNYRKAGRILAEVLQEAKPKVDVGVPLLEVAEFVEEAIRSKGGLPAFPCNISLDRSAAHYTPSPKDESVFAENMVKLDVGVHVDGYIADAAITIDLSGHEDLALASQAGLDAALVHGSEGEFANVRYLTEYWPTFETAGVFVPAAGEPFLLVGPESEYYAKGRSFLKNIEKMIEYRESAEPQYPGIPVASFKDIVKKAMKGRKLKKLGLD